MVASILCTLEASVSTMQLVNFGAARELYFLNPPVENRASGISRGSIDVNFMSSPTPLMTAGGPRACYKQKARKRPAKLCLTNTRQTLNIPTQSRTRRFRRLLIGLDLHRKTDEIRVKRSVTWLITWLISAEKWFTFKSAAETQKQDS